LFSFVFNNLQEPYLLYVYYLLFVCLYGFKVFRNVAARVSALGLGPRYFHSYAYYSHPALEEYGECYKTSVAIT